MAQIVGVRFKPVGKIYHFNPAGFKIKKDDFVVVETSRGVELGKVVVAEKEISPPAGSGLPSASAMLPQKRSRISH